MPRLANDYAFNLLDLKGKHIQEFLGYQTPEKENVEMIYLRVAEQTEWHYLFLDAGIGFWAKHTQGEMNEVLKEFEDSIKIDLAQKYELINAQIKEADCEYLTFSRFCFQFSHGKLLFDYEDYSDIDSDTVISFKK